MTRHSTGAEPLHDSVETPSTVCEGNSGAPTQIDVAHEEGVRDHNLTSSITSGANDNELLIINDQVADLTFQQFNYLNE